MACFDNSPLGIYNMVDDQAIPQGADWDVALQYIENDTVVDFSTGFSAKMQVRIDYDKDIILELSTDDGTIVLGSGAGDTPNVILKFLSSVTSNVSKYEGIYDLELTEISTGLVKKFLKGKFQIDREVTK